MESRSRLGIIKRELCSVCGLSIFIAEKLMISRVPYHRTCFRCARCNAQLAPSSYYETEDGQFCCETCPDEEKTSISVSTAKPYDLDSFESNLRRSLSDEEKSQRILEDKSKIEESGLIEKTSQMRLDFIASNLLLDERQAEDAVDSAASPTVVSASPPNSPRVGQSGEDFTDDVKANASGVNIYEEPATPSLEINEISELEIRCSLETGGLNTKEAIQRPNSIVQQRLRIFEGDREEKRSSEKLAIQSSINNDEAKNHERVTAVAQKLNFEEEEEEGGSERGDPTSEDVDLTAVKQEDSQLRENIETSPIVPIVQQVDKSKIDKENSFTMIAEENIISSNNEIYPEDLNPFASDEEGEEAKVKSKTTDNASSAYNPFDSSDEEEKPQVSSSPKPTLRNVKEAPVKRRLEAPRISLNPFWSDDEEHSDDYTASVSTPTKPVPKPRTIR